MGGGDGGLECPDPPALPEPADEWPPLSWLAVDVPAELAPPLLVSPVPVPPVAGVGLGWPCCPA